jgi:hypothetical protein
MYPLVKITSRWKSNAYKFDAYYFASHYRCVNAIWFKSIYAHYFTAHQIWCEVEFNVHPCELFFLFMSPTGFTHTLVTTCKWKENTHLLRTDKTFLNNILFKKKKNCLQFTPVLSWFRTKIWRYLILGLF